MSQQHPIQTGNAQTDTSDTGDWLVSSFLSGSLGLRHSEDVEIKWSNLHAGETRDSWVTNEVRTTIAILVHGKFRLEFRDRIVELAKPGDYVMWGPGTDHTWLSLEDGTVLMVVRWPSISP